MLLEAIAPFFFLAAGILIHSAAPEAWTAALALNSVALAFFFNSRKRREAAHAA
ncbi:hypothetical protein AB9K35_17080 [Leisingera sp. XS_AS12]|uniref:hypothetical protein n=1 Tax=Leisingera TaxID=191028 RepID=UPI00041C8F67|nr:hypothetical protein [Leisingera caerulea]